MERTFEVPLDGGQVLGGTPPRSLRIRRRFPAAGYPTASFTRLDHFDQPLAFFTRTAA